MLCYRVKEEVRHYDTLHYTTINVVYNQVLHIVSVQTDLVSLCVARLNLCGSTVPDCTLHLL